MVRSNTFRCDNEVMGKDVPLFAAKVTKADVADRKDQILANFGAEVERGERRSARTVRCGMIGVLYFRCRKKGVAFGAVDKIVFELMELFSQELRLRGVVDGFDSRRVVPPKLDDRV